MQKIENLNGTEKTTEYRYDYLNRLKKVEELSDVKVTEYQYDGAGNRYKEIVTKDGAVTISTYSYNEQNWLSGIITEVDGTQTGTVAYSYDNNGNQTEVTQNGALTTKFTYDDANQLISSSKKIDSNWNKVNYKYNGEGIRVSKSDGSSLIRYLYEYDKVVLELEDNGDEIARNIYGANLLMRSVKESDVDQSYYYMYNGHADVTSLVEPSGEIAATYYYDAFGNITESTGDENNNITYAGYQYDDETKLYYLNARMYDPKVARFLQEDTYRGETSNPLSLNLYTYCHNEPMMYKDPSGHYYIKDLWIDDMSKAIKDSEVRKMMFGEDIGLENARSYLANPAFIKKNPTYEKKLIDHIKKQDWFIKNNPDNDHIYRYKIIKDNLITKAGKFGLDNVPFIGGYLTNKIENELGIVGGDSATSLSDAINGAKKEAVEAALEKALEEIAPKIASGTMKFISVGEYIYKKGKEIIKNNGYTINTMDNVTFKFLEQYDCVMKNENKEYKSNSFYSNDVGELEERVKVLREFVKNQEYYFLKPIDSTGETFFGSNLDTRSFDERRAEYEYRKKDFQGDNQTQFFVKGLIINSARNINEQAFLYNAFKDIRMKEFYERNKNKGYSFGNQKSRPDAKPYPVPQPNRMLKPTPTPSL